MTLEQITPRLRNGELDRQSDKPQYFIKSEGRSIILDAGEAEIVGLINNLRTISEIAESYCLKLGKLNFKDFFIRLNRIAAKNLINHPQDFNSQLGDYLKSGFTSDEDYKGCYVSDPSEALQFQPDRLKSEGAQYLTEIVDQIPLFEGLDPKSALVFFENGRIRKFEKNELIINKSESGHEIYILLRGSAQAFSDDQTLSEMLAGSVFGETPYVFDLNRSASVRATSPSLALELSRKAIREIENRLSEIKTQEIFQEGQAQDSLGLVKRRFIINRIRLDQSSFKGVHSSLIESFFSKAHVVNFVRGQKIVGANTPGKEFYILIAGHAEILREGQHIAELYGGDYLGEISLFKAVPRTADVIATTDCSLLRIFKNDFYKLLCSNLRLALLMEANIDQRLSESHSDSISLAPRPKKLLF